MSQQKSITCMYCKKTIKPGELGALRIRNEGDVYAKCKKCKGDLKFVKKE